MRLAPVVRGKVAREAIVSPDRLEVQAQLVREHGDVVRLEQGPFVVHLVRGPHEIRQVLIEHAARFRKGRAMDLLASQLGQGLIVADGDDWIARRRMWKPIFRPRSVEAFEAPLSRGVDRLVAGWQRAAGAGESVVLLDEARAFAWDVTSTQILGVTPDPALREPLLEVLQSAHVARDMTPEFREKLRSVDAALDDVLARRRASRAPPDDMLGALLAVRRDGDPLDPTEIRGELRNMFLGSYDTTANALAWSWLALATEPAAGPAIRPGTTSPDGVDRAGVERVVMESLRLYPPVYNFGREALDDVEIGGFAVPRRSYVLIGTHLVHRHPDHWPSPDSFDPSRFDAGARDGRHPLAYMPFGAGPRGCIGGELAMRILVEAVAAVAARFTLALESQVGGLRPELNVTLTPPRTRARVGLAATGGKHV